MYITILFIIFATAYPANSQFSCRNRYGKSVDWFVGYKLPSRNDAEYPGTTFYYADEHSTNWGPPENLNSSQSAVAQTLFQYYSRKDDKETFYLLYNDGKPVENKKKKKTTSTRGHAKGVAVFGKDSGFWLIHSVPRFPPRERYSYVSNGETYGQTFLCITMKTKTSLGKFVEAMKYVLPNVYDLQLPKRLVARFPFLRLLQPIKKYDSKNAQEKSLVQHFRSKRGYHFINFEKTGTYGDDLYSKLIAPELKTSMYVETWLNGAANDFPSLCTGKYKVINIEGVNITGKNFPSSRDHSKWAVGANSTEPFVCIADINRQVSQTKRGGGAVCFKSQNIWKMFQQSIVKLQECGLKEKKTTKKPTKKTKTKTKTKKEKNKVQKHEK